MRLPRPAAHKRSESHAGELVAGAPADIVVIDTDRPQFAGVPEAALLDAHISHRASAPCATS